MTKLLSTSNFNQEFFDNKPWPFAIIGSVFIVCVIVFFFEFNIRSHHWTPSVSDSKELWAQERERASLLGKDALILIGGSRIQLGIELDILAKLSGKKPVQLAIDGANFYSVLKNLAEDNRITGNIIIDLHEGSIEGLTQRDKVWEWVENFYNKKKALYLAIDQRIHNFITGFMVTKIESAKNSFDLPDGSHLDKKDKINFTKNLFMIMRQEFGI